MNNYEVVIHIHLPANARPGQPVAESLRSTKFASGGAVLPGELIGVNTTCSTIHGTGMMNFQITAETSTCQTALTIKQSFNFTFQFIQMIESMANLHSPIDPLFCYKIQ